MGKNILTEDGIAHSVHSCIGEILAISITEIVPEATLSGLGADSFHYVELMARLDERFGISLPPIYAVAADYTVATLTRAVATALDCSR